MSEFEPTADQVRGDVEMPPADEGTDTVELEGVPAAVETGEVHGVVGKQDATAVAEATDDAVAESREPSAVERALEELDRLAGRDLVEHPEVYQRIHADLRDALAAIDDA